MSGAGGGPPLRPAPAWLTPATAMAFARRIVDRLARAGTVAAVATTVATGLRDALGTAAIVVHAMEEHGTVLVPVLADGVVSDTAELVSGPVPLDAAAPVAAVVRRAEAAVW